MLTIPEESVANEPAEPRPGPSEAAVAEWAELVESIRAFLGNGGTLIDTSPTYGRAEKNLGEIFRRIGSVRDKAFIATKISTTSGRLARTISRSTRWRWDKAAFLPGKRSSVRGLQGTTR